MAWVRIDDGYSSHPKVAAAGAEGSALDVAGMCYAARHATDGHVPTVVLATLFPLVDDPKAAARRLVEVGRWHAPDHDCPDCMAVTDGWVIHDFLDYNPSAAKREDRRRKRAKAGRKGGQHSGRARSKSEAKPQAKPQAKGSSEGLEEGLKEGSDEGGDAPHNPRNDGDEASASPRGQASAQASAAPTWSTPSRPVPSPGGSTEPPPSNSSEPEDGSGPAVSDDARELTRRFATGAKANGHKLPTEGTKAHRRWLQEMDKLLRIDGWDADEVRGVIDWCVADHGDGTYPGEAANVQAVPKFRQRYSQLRLKAQAAQRANGSAPAYDPANRDGPDGRPKAVM
jgi:hypothetical protein